MQPSVLPATQAFSSIVEIVLALALAKLIKAAQFAKIVPLAVIPAQLLVVQTAIQPISYMMGIAWALAPLKPMRADQLA